MWLWIVEGLLAWLVVSAVAGVVIGQVIRRADAEQRRIDRAVLGEVVPASDLERAVCGRLRHGHPRAGETPLGESGWRTWRVEAR